MSLVKGRKYVVLGVANERSIAWAIAKALHEHGAQLAFTYMNEAIERRVRPLAEQLGAEVIVPCDVQSDESLDKAFAHIGDAWGSIDGVVHSVAYAERDDLQNRFIETSRSGFSTALEVSAYSLIAVAKRAEPLLSDGGSIVTMTYLGSQRVVTNYNVMGVAKAALEASVRYLATDLGQKNIRVNAVSAGPIRTLAASGIPHFKELLKAFADKAPMRRNVELEDVAGTALYLLSPLSCGVTGDILWVDCGYSTLGL